MTSQHFAAEEGWEKWEEWPESSAINNNNMKAQIQQVPPVPQAQTFAQPPSNAPVYSPFAYSQQHPPQPPMNHQPAAPANPQYQYGNPSFFNNSNFNDNVNNNQQHPGFNHSAAPPTQPPLFDPARSFRTANNVQQDDGKKNATLQYQPAPAGYQRPPTSFMPSPSTSPMQLPPPPQAETFTDDLYTSNQQKNLPAPPTYDGNFMRQVPEQPLNNYSTTAAWPNSGEQLNKTQQSWPMSQPQSYSQHPVTHSVLDSFSSHQPFVPQVGLQNPPQQHQPLLVPPQPAHQNHLDVTDPFGHGASARFFENAESATGDHPVQQEASPHLYPTKQENVENVQLDTTQTVPSRLTPIATPQEIFYPENRERLDDMSTPPVTSFTDRHNYLVTGQLSQDRVMMPPVQSHHQNSFHEELPPPGLSRMVVGEPESNREQENADVLPPGLNRMVTGTDMSYNYQRQADGEVSHVPVLPRPQTNTPFTHQHQHNMSDVPQQSFNTSDRNLYLVAGESDVNSQRVIPGVESDHHLPPTIMNPMQNLHIQDDDDFSVQERNVTVDGMETAPETQQHRSADAEPREEDIDGANDNSESFIVVPTVHDVVSNEPESDVREEAIEGANDYNDDVAGRSTELKSRSHKKQKPEMSSEDSELRELEASKVKPKSRRGKKYADDTNESENELSDVDKKEKYDDRRRTNREKMSREDYEKYRRREKERRSGDRPPRRGDDTDGSKYGRRTDDEDDFRRNKPKKSSRSRNLDDDEGEEKEKKKREKYRDSGGRRKDDAYDYERRERRRRDRYYEDDGFSGRRSQNTSDREYAGDRYARRSRDHAEKGKYDANSYYQQYPGYDPNYDYSTYYQKMQYYETLRRTNPQAYYEWYTKYMSGMQQTQAQQQPTMDDIGGSLRSGYSSSNEKDRASASRFLPGGNVSNPLRSMNSSFIVDHTDYQSLQGFPAAVKDLTQSYASLNYGQAYGHDAYSRNKSGAAATEAQRLTPKKFQSLHGFVKLSNGVMATIDTINGYSVKIENVPLQDKARRLYQSFPGPLIRNVSHKKTVIEFCEEKLKQEKIVGPQRASYSLLWGYLILMLRQNGNYTEGDISELLMKNADEFKTTLDSAASDDVKNATNEDVTDVSENEDNAASEKNSNSASQSHVETSTTSGMSDKVVIHKFRDYLLYGNINDALDFATDNNLWGHALFLASKVDRRHHANVMLKFANKLPYNDPLQTLYQIMSGRMPACVTHLDDKWGDWRPHLAMIISNCTDKPELVKRSIMALGDTLANRGDVFGSQFCYLLVEPHFTEYCDDGKMVLLGSSHQKPFREFASDDAIIMTEVYEFARSLSDEHFFVPSLQKFKFLLAGRMLDYGMQLKCLLYMEQMSKCIAADPNLFEKSFIAKVYELADRLKFYDPVMEKSYEDNFNNNGLEATEDQKWLQDLAVLLQSYDEPSMNYQPVQEQTPQHSSTGEVYNQIPSGIYDPMSAHQTPTHVAPASYEEDRSHEQHQAVDSYNQTGYQQPDPNYSYEYQNTAENHNQPFPEQQPYDPTAYNSFQPQPTTQTDYGGYNYDQNAYQQQQPTITMGNTVTNKFEERSAGDDDKKKSPVKKPEADKGKRAVAPNGSAQAGGGGWFGGIFSKLSMKPKNQMILPDDKNPTILWDEATKKWVNKNEDEAEAESFKPPPKMGDMMGSKPMPSQQQAMPPQQHAMPPQQQPAAQMPQMNYSQPQTVAQPTMESASPAMAQHQQQFLPQQQSQPQQANSITTATPELMNQQPPAPNMFKMQKGRNLKKSYVDILGNTGQTVSQPKELAGQMDMQFFNPIQQQPKGMQFYNPNDFQ